MESTNNRLFTYLESSQTNTDTPQKKQGVKQVDGKTGRTFGQLFTCVKVKSEAGEVLYVNRRSLKNFLSRNPDLKDAVKPTFFTRASTIVHRLEAKDVFGKFEKICQSGEASTKQEAINTLIKPFVQEKNFAKQYLEKFLGILGKNDNVRDEVIACLIDVIGYENYDACLDVWLHADSKCFTSYVKHVQIDKNEKTVDEKLNKLFLTMCEKGATKENIDTLIDTLKETKKTKFFNEIPKKSNSMCYPPITMAIMNKQEGVVQALLEQQQVDVNKNGFEGSSGKTYGCVVAKLHSHKHPPLEMAIENNSSVDIIQKLIEKGAKITEPVQQGVLRLVISKEYSVEDVVKLCKIFKIQINSASMQDLILAHLDDTDNIKKLGEKLAELQPYITEDHVWTQQKMGQFLSLLISKFEYRNFKIDECKKLLQMLKQQKCLSETDFNTVRGEQRLFFMRKKEAVEQLSDIVAECFSEVKLNTIIVL